VEEETFHADTQQQYEYISGPWPQMAAGSAGKVEEKKHWQEKAPP
jgi:hypothetical protein